jgi:hypothetical protein
MVREDCRTDSMWHDPVSGRPGGKEANGRTGPA